MLPSVVIVAALRDLVPWIPVLVNIVALSSFGIVLKYPRSRYWDDEDQS